MSNFRPSKKSHLRKNNICIDIRFFSINFLHKNMIDIINVDDATKNRRNKSYKVTTELTWVNSLNFFFFLSGTCFR